MLDILFYFGHSPIFCGKCIVCISEFSLHSNWSVLELVHDGLNSHNLFKGTHYLCRVVTR